MVMALGGLLAGRGNEQALLDGYLAELTRGSGNAVLIEGEPGIGKTILVSTALGRLPPASCQVFRGRGDELGQEIPLAPFLDALDVRRPSANARRTAIAGLLRGEGVTGRGADVPALVAEQLITLTMDETAARPAVLVIDDLQWADPASVKLWGRLARIAGQVPLLLIGLTRPVPQRDDLLALRRAVAPAARIHLTALPQPAVAELAGRLAGGSPDAGLLGLAAGAGGNPLYLAELFAALHRAGAIETSPAGTARLTAQTVPGSLSAAIAGRLDFLPGPTREMLRAAALLGAEFAVPDLTTVLGTTIFELMPTIDEARAAGILTESRNGTVLAFRHPLIRDALCAELPATVRGAWHLQAGRALAAAGAPPDRVARQLLRSITPSTTVDEWTLEWLAISAESLVGQAPRVAAELLAQAVSAIPADSARHGWLASRLAEASYRTGDRPTAERVATRALAHATDPDLLVALHWTLAQCRLLTGQAEESFAAIEQALASPGLSAKHVARLRTLAARVSGGWGDLPEARREAEAALAAAMQVDDAWGTAWALHVLALVAVASGDVTGGLLRYDRALHVVETDPALADLGLLLEVNKAVALLSLDRFAEALAAAERARQRADQAGTAIRLAQAHSVLGQALFETGRWDDALAAVAAVPESVKEPRAAACDLAVAAEIRLRRKDLDAAREHLAGAEARAQRAGRRAVPALALARSLEREQAGRPGDALAVLAAALDADEFGETGDLFADAVRLALTTGDETTAKALTRRADALAARGDIPRLEANALLCRGMTERDAPALLAAAQRYADAGRPLPRAKALEAAAGCLAEAGDRPGARQAFEQAVEIYESLRAGADLDRVHAELRAHGIRHGSPGRQRKAASGWDSLTGTELRVAVLVQEGLSNPEIAARLMLSRKTVATHVSHILKKLDVATRTDIARESALRTMPPGGDA
jgi:DNA-binding CsgD family transcriptional regulator